MRLAAWLEREKLSPAAFAARVGVHRSTVGRWLDGAARPDWDQLTKIKEDTGGEVTPNDFMPDAEEISSPPNEEAA
jgi:transcriptional regulator with XRE-family HTH domain